MTELGMALTNPLDGERHLGYVGQPFPSVHVRLVDPDSETELPLESEQEGELRVKGPTVFQEYWRKPEATAKETDAQGWFKTGDIAQYNVDKASFRIRGRASADIIKSAGYKISALDVERVLLSHPQIHECAVFGITDEKYGQVVSALVRTAQEACSREELLEPPLKRFLEKHLARLSRATQCVLCGRDPQERHGQGQQKGTRCTLWPSSDDCSLVLVPSRDVSARRAALAVLLDRRQQCVQTVVVVVVRPSVAYASCVPELRIQGVSSRDMQATATAATQSASKQTTQGKAARNRRSFSETVAAVVVWLNERRSVYCTVLFIL